MKFETRLLLTIDNPMLRFHRVHERHLLPGLAYVDLVCQVFARAGHDPLGLVLRKLAIYRPLVVASDAEVLLHIACEPRAAGAWQVQIDAGPADGARASTVRHATVEVHAEATAFLGETLDLLALRAGGAEAGSVTDLSEVYALCRRHALVHDGFMQAHGRVHVVGDHVIVDCRVSPEAEAGASALVFHPALLDGAAIALSAGLLMADPTAEPALYLPLMVDEFRATHALQTACVARVARSSVTTVNELRRMDIAFFDAQGHQVAAISGFTTKRIHGADAIAAQSVGPSAGAAPRAVSDAPLGAPTGRPDDVAEQVLQRLLAERLNVVPSQVPLTAGYHELGLKSASLLELVHAINATLGIELPPTLLFEHTNVSELAGYLRAHHADRLTGASRHDAVPAGRPASEPSEAVDRLRDEEPVAIIGMSARFPMATNLREFWANLKAGRDCVTDVPANRWDTTSLSGLRSPSGKPMSRWGGFIDDVDCFDPQFFRISPREAQGMDPQERLFLQACWEAIEDSGHTPASLVPAHGPNRRRRVGVFAGVMHKDYALMGAALNTPAQPWLYVQSNAGIANRVSYACGFHGPSMSVDTQCSSSLVALHLGVQSLRRGESDAVLVGGVNLSLHPGKYMTYGLMDMHASDGRCKSFADGADGYVSSEGVGVVVLKPLSRAQADGDAIYGVIRATSSNHGGTVSGFTVPSPVAQADAIEDCLKKAGVSPRSIGYVEAHGTGTSLGDPIEIDGLVKAYLHDAPAAGTCAIGSIKSNIGHAESAAGIGGLIKVALQLKHRWLVPSLHAEALNTYIDWARTPFRVQREGQAWAAPTDPEGRLQARRAGLSSFGATGSNAHVIIEEHLPAVPVAARCTGPALVPLSAQAPAQLCAYARALAEALRDGDLALVDVAGTLQVGRVAQNVRVAFVADTLSQLIAQLEKFARDDGPVAGCVAGEAGAATTDPHDVPLGLEALAAAWVTGRASLDALPAPAGFARVSLPTYPFAKERHWLPEPAAYRAVLPALHPLLGRNTSTVDSLRFSTDFTGAEPFLADHVVRGQRVLPGAAQLEMARAAAAQALDLPVLDASGWVLGDIVFSSPAVVGEGGLTLHIALAPLDDDTLSFELTSGPASAPTCHGSGTVSWSDVPVADDDGVIADVGPASRAVSGEDCYAAFDRMGLRYGPTHRAIRQLRVGTDAAGRRQVLGDLSLHGAAQADVSRHVLHPGLLDAALQCTIGLLADALGQAPRDGLWLPFAIDRVDVRAPLPADARVRVRAVGPAANAPVRTFDVDVADLAGRLCCRIAGLSLRQTGVPANAAFAGISTWEQQWVPQALPASRSTASQRIVCLVPDAGARDGLAAALAHTLPAARLTFVVTGATSDGVAEAPWVPALARAAAEGPINVLLFLGTATACDTLRVLEQPAALVRALVGSGIVCHGVVLAALCADPLARACADAWIGYERSSRMLLPETTMKVVAVVATGRPSEVDSYARIAAEVLAPASGHVCHDHGERHVLRLRPARLDAPATPPIRRGGTYLVTGGMGALGEQLALHLATQHAACVVLMGRGAFDDDKRARLSRLEAAGGRGLYVQADVARRDEVSLALSRVREHFGALHGVFHVAGILSPHSVTELDTDAFFGMLAPKVQGSLVLDALLRDSGLDFICHFSSSSAVLGDMGVCAYAVANRFQSAWSRWHKLPGTRHVAIEWPLWKDGGIGVGDEETTARYLQTTGQRRLETPEAMALCERALAHDQAPRLVMAGDSLRIERMLRLLDGQTAASADTPPALPVASEPSSLLDGEDAELRARTHKYLARELSAVLQLAPGRIDPHAALDAYGIDSVMVIELTRALEGTFGRLSKTLLFEHRTLDALAGHLMQGHRARLEALLGAGVPHLPPQPVPQPVPQVEEQVEAPPRRRALRSRGAWRTEAPAPGPAHEALEIAVVGLSGRYPGAGDLTQFWQNLLDGESSIGEIPADRWDHARYFDADGKGRPGTYYSRWGGFLDGVDEFDPLLFHVSPKDAATMDPQERLFLQCAHSAIEDAGYTREALTRNTSVPNVGVFVGVMWEEYQLYAAQAQAQGQGVTVMGNPSSVANRVSFWGNFNGPSMAIDTMCSSSLTAIHLACASLQRGECSVAVAGGVNVTLHPNKYLALSQAQFVSSEGLCRAFGTGGDGYVPAEGVGAVLLKPLRQALADGDQVYGVIKGAALNHGGRTNGYTVPNPAAQRQVVERALAQAGVPARAVSYVEAHGTGTSLGDPIEIAGLTQAFGGPWPDGQTCAIGSVKSNIGHCESAAGISGLTKVLLQMKHRTLVKSLHSEQLNPHIDFEQTPFSVLQAARDWQPAVATLDGVTREFPRIAGLSSFGAGGSNVHLVVAEHTSPEPVRVAPGPQLVLLSARTQVALNARIDQLLAARAAGRITEEDFASMAYVLQVGREPMAFRVAVTARTLAEAAAALSAWRYGKSDVHGLHAGEVALHKEVAGLFAASEELRQAAANMLADGKLDEVAGLWTRGVRFDWHLLRRAGRPRRMSLPTYPFAREKYWAFDRAAEDPGTPPVRPRPPRPAAASFSDDAMLKVLDGLEAATLDLDAADAAVRTLLAGIARGSERTS